MLLDSRKLIEKGIIIFKRQPNHELVPFSQILTKSNHKDQNQTIYIRQGQLNSDQKLHGIGAKITLKPKYFNSKIYSFVENDSFIEQGEFKNDEFDLTFGRRIYIKGTTRLGWFIEDGSKLHGYGIDIESKKPAGLFENGLYKHKNLDVELFDYEIDFIAQQIDFGRIVIKKQDII